MTLEFLENPDFNASRQEITSAFFLHLQQVLLQLKHLPLNSENLARTTKEPHLWWLSRGALRIEQAARLLLRAIGVLPTTPQEVQQHQSSREGTGLHL